MLVVRLLYIIYFSIYKKENDIKCFYYTLINDF